MNKAEAIQVLRDAGHRITAPRLTLLDLLWEAEGALTAEQIRARARARGLRTDLSTVYRNLSTFEALGWLETVLGVNGERHYSVHRDGVPAARVLCLDCGKLKPLDAGMAPLGEALRRSGFHPESLRVNLAAHCRHEACDE